jgi:Ca2+-transporting ATPase
MATLNRSPEGKKIIFIKGAPETIVPLLKEDNNPDLIRSMALQQAGIGRRLIAFAAKEIDPAEKRIRPEHLLDNFLFLGLQGMIDPPREEVRHSIKACHQAGITVKMITGDHPGTAIAIAEALGIQTRAQGAITGADLERMTGATFQMAVVDHNVFARVAPEHKLRIVKALQESGHVVAMTGDGVNDAPALKKADIGVAMGIGGTAVAKEAADMILVDDNFGSIRAAVEEGRRVYDNLIKSLAYILPTSIALGLVTFLGVALFPGGTDMLLRPMQPVQILWINLITAVALSLPLALEALEPDAMNRPPRKPDAPVLPAFVVFRMFMVAIVMAGGTIGMFLWEYQMELSKGTQPLIALREAQTMAVTTMVFFQVFYLLNCRSLSHAFFSLGTRTNVSVYWGIAAIALAQGAFIFSPWMNEAFDSHPIKAEAIGLTALVALTIFPIVELEKWIRRSLATSRGHTGR